MFTSRTRKSLAKALLTRRSPVYVQFAVSRHCNLACDMCGATDSRADEEELALAGIERLAGTLEALGAGFIVLSGGEPLLRKDIVDVVRIFSSRGFSTRIQTNGTLITPGLANQLAEAGLAGATVSLDSLEPTIQDGISGSSGTWDRVIEGIANLSAAMPRRSPILGLNTVVSNKNLSEIPGVVRFATDIGYQVSLIPVHLDERGRFIVRTENEDYKIPPARYGEVDRVFEQIRHLKRSGYNVYNTYRHLRSSREYLKGRLVPWFCDSPALYFAVSPSGNFLPCVDIPMKESMLEGDFPRRYRSKAFIDEVRREVESCPGCMYPCWPEVSFFVRSPRVFSERLFQSARLALSSRADLSSSRIRSLAARHREAAPHGSGG